MPEDPSLLPALRAGDPAALARLFEANADRVYGLAFSLLRDAAAAEDVVQETFLAAMTHLERFEGRAQVSTWLYRIAYNASLTRLRQRIDEPLPSDEHDPDEAPPLPRALAEWDRSPEEILADQQALEQLDRAVGELSQALRAVFLLRDVEGLSTAETAAALGLSESAVKVRLHRARLTLRERLAQSLGRAAEASR